MQQVNRSRAVWRKSIYSSGNGQCVEVAFVSSGVAVRDSKDRGGSVLVFTSHEWDAFIDGVMGGAFARP